MLVIRRLPIVTILISALLAGCATTPDGKSGGVEQTRASQRGALRGAGISEDCIQQLSFSALTQVETVTRRSSRSSMDRMMQRGRLRAVAATECPTL